MFLFPGSQFRKRDVYTKLVESLSRSDAHFENIEQIEGLLNLIIVDHSLTGCLLALVFQRVKQVSFILRQFFMNNAQSDSYNKSEAVTQRCSVKKVFLEISHNSQKNTCAGVSFLIK